MKMVEVEYVTDCFNRECYQIKIDDTTYEYYPAIDLFEIGGNWEDCWCSPILACEEIDQLSEFLKFITEVRKVKKNGNQGTRRPS